MAFRDSKISRSHLAHLLAESMGAFHAGTLRAAASGLAPTGQHMAVLILTMQIPGSFYAPNIHVSVKSGLSARRVCDSQQSASCHTV
jgi:hypothetical protein